MTGDQRDSVIKKLAYIGISCSFNDEDSLSVSFKIDNERYHLNVSLDEYFPDSFPLVQILEEDYAKINKPLPHIYGNHYICVFDKTTSIPDGNNPIDLIVTTISSARNILKSGIKETNKKDFIDEIASYWNLDENHCSKAIIHSFVSHLQNAHHISIFHEMLRSQREKFIVADSDGAMQVILSNLNSVNGGNCLGENSALIEGIYVPLTAALYPPFPETNWEWYQLIQSLVKDNVIYKKFVSKHIKDGSYIMLSIPLSNQRYFLFMIKHAPTLPSVKNGFREGHFPAKLAFRLEKPKRKVTKYNVVDLRHSRIFKRGGMGGKIDGMNNIGVIGVGSLGSYIAKGLSEYGTTKITLVDDDAITSENIARHLCGYSYLYQPKVEAVKHELLCHDLSLKILDYYMSGEKYLHDHLADVNQMEYLFIAAADWRLDKLIYNLKRKGKLKIPVVVCWVEPYCLACNVLIIQESQDVKKVLFDKNLRFKYRVIKNAESQFRREAGCQSTFIPYSAYELRRFIYTFLHYFVVNFVRMKKEGNYSYTWCGELSKAESLGCKLTPIYKDVKDYSECIKRFD